MYLQDARLKLT